MESNKKPIKKSLVVTIVFLVIVMLLTFCSKTLYNLNLPSVKFTNPTSGSLKHVFTCESVVSAKKNYDLYAPAEQKILKILVNEGDYVLKGDELIRLDTSVLEKDLLQLELEKQQVKDSKRYLSSIAYQMSIEIANQKIEAKQSEINNSIINAPADGTVTVLSARVGMTVNSAAPLITIGAIDEGFQVVLSVTQRQAAWFEHGDKLDIYIPILNKSFDGFITQVKANENGDMDILADLVDSSNVIQAGQLAEISFEKMSSEYTTLIPISALHTDSSRDYIFKVETVSGPLGDEYRLYKMYVRVLDQDDTNIAVDAELYPNDQIVTESDQELFGGRVKITED